MVKENEVKENEVKAITVDKVATKKITKVQAAVATYLGRQDRSRHPIGTFDRAGRWYPDEDEKCECCDSIRQPSRSWGLSLNTHCRTKAHVAKLYQLTEKQEKQYSKLIKKAKLMG